jgi:phosphoglycolate phosphatase
LKRKAVVFDLDGTLLDTLEDLADSMNAALAARGLPTHPAEAYKTFVGDGVENLAYRTAPASRFDADLYAALVRDMRGEYTRRWADKTRPYDGVADLLDGLAARGIKLAVLSNKPQDFTELCVAKLLGRWRFGAVLGVGDSVPPKPDTTGLGLVLARMSVSAAECLYVGDTNTDMRTASAARVFAVGAAWGFRTVEELRANGADAIIHRPAELLELLD